MAKRTPAEEIKRTLKERQRKARAGFPFELVETTGSRALATWEKLKGEGRGVPVVIGGEESLERLMEALEPGWPEEMSAQKILAAAEKVRYPQDIFERHAESDPKASAPVGTWPKAVPSAPGLSIARDVLSGKPLKSVHIALVPTDDWTSIPAHLRWGGWNACPRPAIHVAALRSWRDRYGAELVGLSADTMNLRVAHTPRTRAEALDLAREQYAYCSDIVDQGVGTLSNLAASLMADPWWYFWWD